MTTPSAIGGTPALDAALDVLATRLRQSTAIVQLRGRRGGQPTGQGAAVIWTTDGLLLTNAHVAREDRVEVALPDGRTVPGRIVGRDPGHDLAALQVDPADLPLVPALVGEPASLRPGALVVAFGHPLGVSNSLAVGVFNGMHAPISRHHRGMIGQEFLRADIRLAPGNSGGPLADAAGRVVGLNTLIANGLGYAVSVDRARRLVRSLSPRPRLGLTVRPVRVRLRDGATAPASALLVLEVARGLPADRAGCLSGDVLFAFDGRALHATDDLLDALAAARPGESHRVELGRGGQRTQRTLTLDHLAPHASRAA